MKTGWKELDAAVDALKARIESGELVWRDVDGFIPMGPGYVDPATGWTYREGYKFAGPSLYYAAGTPFLGW